MSHTPLSLTAALERVRETPRRELGPRFQVHPGARQAAILMLFGAASDDVVDTAELAPDDLDIVLEVRADTLRAHPGEVAFPGGGRDPEDADITATALREAQEEIGFDPAEARVLATLAETGTVSAFRVTPVIAWRTAPAHFSPVDTAETSSVHRVRVADLLDPAHRFTTIYHHPTGRFRGPGFEIPGAVVWGFTAYVLDEFFTASGWARPWDATREVDISR